MLQIFWLKVSQFSSLRENSSVLQTYLPILQDQAVFCTHWCSPWGWDCYLRSKAGTRVCSWFAATVHGFSKVQAVFLNPWRTKYSDSFTATIEHCWTCRCHFQMSSGFYFKRECAGQFSLSNKVLRITDTFWNKINFSVMCLIFSGFGPIHCNPLGVFEKPLEIRHFLKHLKVELPVYL